MMFGWGIFAIRSLKYNGVTVDSRPSAEVALYAIEILSYSGDTHFANIGLAF